jgi:hypothetical protein
MPKLEKIMITAEFVEKACFEVGEYSQERLAQEFERFFKGQPAICEFVAELTTDSSPKIQELTLFLSYMVTKAVEMSVPPMTGIQPVGHDSIEAAYRESESWIDRMSEAEGAELQATLTSSLQSETEPVLLRYVIAELNEPLEDGSYLADEEKGEIFFLLKTVISSLTRRPSEIEEWQNDG